MPRLSKPDNEKLVLHSLRISPLARERLAALPIKKKKAVIAEVRKAVERTIIAMTAQDISQA